MDSNTDNHEKICQQATQHPLRKLACAALMGATVLAGCDLVQSSTDFSQGDTRPSGIAFASTRDGNFDIYLMDATVDNVQQLTFSTVDEQTPTWSPDGTLMAYSKGHELYNSDIFIMSIASGVETNLLCPQRGGPQFGG